MVTCGKGIEARGYRADLSSPPSAGRGSTRTRRPASYYLRARYYDPATMQFLTPDPLDKLGGMQRPYAYADGDPINGADPSGLYQEFWGTAGRTIVYSRQETEDLGHILDLGGWSATGADLFSGRLGKSAAEWLPKVLKNITAPKLLPGVLEEDLGPIGWTATGLGIVLGGIASNGGHLEIVKSWCGLGILVPGQGPAEWAADYDWRFNPRYPFGIPFRSLQKPPPFPWAWPNMPAPTLKYLQEHHELKSNEPNPYVLP